MRLARPLNTRLRVVLQAAVLLIGLRDVAGRMYVTLECSFIWGPIASQENDTTPGINYVTFRDLLRKTLITLPTSQAFKHNSLQEYGSGKLPEHACTGFEA